MREVAVDLISRMASGHTRGQFSIPVVDFARVFAPSAPPAELQKVAARGDFKFAADSEHGGTFALAQGPKAFFDLGREGLVMKVPERMSGRYEIMPEAFRIKFTQGEELEGCKRLFILVCNRVLSVEVSTSRVDVRLPSRLFDLCVEFE
jgi:hypothetical protein